MTIPATRPPFAENEIALETKGKWQIPNEMPKERAPAALQASVELWQERCPEAQLRSITATYNCVGMVVANRRSHVEPEHLLKSLRDDGFRAIQLHEAREGDVVVYRLDGEIVHVGLLARRTLSDEMVLSKWGHDGEYLHPIKHVPLIFGAATEFWTDRKLP